MNRIGLLKFSPVKNNAKLIGLGKTGYTFSLPAGWSCPFAHDCLAKADEHTGKMTMGANASFKCFSASTESIFTAARAQRHYNFKTLKSSRNMKGLILRSIPKNADIIRTHVSGDFYNEQYFMAWLEVAKMKPSIVFYGYTKSIRYLVKYKNEIPKNFRFVASWGGTEDHLILEHGLKSAYVVYHPEEAESLGLEIDHDDSKAYANDKKSFALLLHGKQKPDSEAALALKRMNREKIEYSYSTVNK